jgi:hypothetical protein
MLPCMGATHGLLHLGKNAEDFGKQSPEMNIWTSGGGSNRRPEKSA